MRGIPGLFTNPNSKTGDCVYISGHGNITIKGETALTCSEASSRTVVYACLDSGRSTFYWDKATGILLEVSYTSESGSYIFRAKETNIWSTDPKPSIVTVVFFTTCIVTITLALAVFSFVRTQKGKMQERLL